MTFSSLRNMNAPDRINEHCARFISFKKMAAVLVMFA